MDTINDAIQGAEDAVLMPTTAGFMIWLSRTLGITVDFSYDCPKKDRADLMDFLVDRFWDEYRKDLDFARKAQERLRATV